jgi:hypothetical protein
MKALVTEVDVVLHAQIGGVFFRVAEALAHERFLLGRHFSIGF